ncbi:MAG: hypothetical protein A2Y33_08615 [Spirochaetes bacterium GWF1_51_8]|nr:MAG: hypothetical protein A2Y33_08615 [Spirochaetes bacterium GWF1_51_8]
MKSIPLFLLAVLFSVSPVFAENSDHPIDIKLDKSMQADESTHGMVQALTTAMKEWDAELNKYYKELQDVLDKKGKESLKKVQLEWIAFRDAEFELLDAMMLQAEGTMYQVFNANYQMNIVKDRALELKDYYDAFFGAGK